MALLRKARGVQQPLPPPEEDECMALLRKARGVPPPLSPLPSSVAEMHPPPPPSVAAAAVAVTARAAELASKLSVPPPLAVPPLATARAKHVRRGTVGGFAKPDFGVSEASPLPRHPDG